LAFGAQFGVALGNDAVDARRHPRFKLETEICVYPRNRAVVRGDSVDISESGISAILREEIPLNEVVRLEFSLPPGAVEVLAMVRQRNAFRYGFQFLESDRAHQLIRRTCNELAIEQSLQPPQAQ
jgi:c-di-GMP-binding flagellar brake protein YcgR